MYTQSSKEMLTVVSELDSMSSSPLTENRLDSSKIGSPDSPTLISHPQVPTSSDRLQPSSVADDTSKISSDNFYSKNFTTEHLSRLQMEYETAQRHQEYENYARRFLKTADDQFHPNDVRPDMSPCSTRHMENGGRINVNTSADDSGMNDSGTSTESLAASEGRGITMTSDEELRGVKDEDMTSLNHQHHQDDVIDYQNCSDDVDVDHDDVDVDDAPHSPSYIKKGKTSSS
jgi:hypothetical protein